MILVMAFLKLKKLKKEKNLPREITQNLLTTISQTISHRIKVSCLILLNKELLQGNMAQVNTLHKRKSLSTTMVSTSVRQKVLKPEAFSMEKSASLPVKEIIMSF